MRCPFCESDTSVEISRPSRNTSSVWRRRQCENCNKLFSTREKPDLFLSVTVKKEAGQEEPFSEDKLFISIHECFSHRNDALEASRALSDTIVGKLIPYKGAIETEAIVKQAYKTILRVDRSAAVFYKAHHRLTS